MNLIYVEISLERAKMYTIDRGKQNGRHFNVSMPSMI